MTNEYSNLKERIEEIGNNFQTIIDTDPIKQAEQKNQDFIRAYILLCHAEFEKYFESIVKLLYNKLNSTIGSGSFSEQELVTLNKVIENSANITKTNNGIKISNLKKMLEPTGFDTSTIDPVYESKIGTFAGKRCEIAHKGDPILCNTLSFNREKTDIEWLMNETEQQFDLFFYNY